MILPVNLQIKTISIDQLKRVHKFDEVLGYCAKCNNFNKNYSCPDFAFDPIEYLDEFKFATLILTVVRTDKLKDHIKEFGEKDLESQVQKLHMPVDKDPNYNISDALAMKCFNKVKDIMANELLDVEAHIDKGVSSPPGSCTRCLKCTKIIGEECKHPDQLRYSLEALGFLISELYVKYFDLELEWSMGEIPEAYHSCSAIFHNEESQAKTINKLMTDNIQNIII